MSFCGPMLRELNLMSAKDLALAYADSVGAEYVLAQDPDADRFTAAEKYDEASKGAFDNILSSNAPKRSWRIFTGDQLGALFAYRQLNAFKAAEKPLGTHIMNLLRGQL